ncbi:uracil phosphoribosyltransferase [Aquimarina sp. 2201CG5-10]|uniref:uracil phosphoribosyltransferase n=1 Tax=Aquimarina callyspongiae TaxID=3098150 RepID=UPI002AB44299|nr:uracil phosphoribosyltransferase [Aquimarina sp. 2201CG5-10]MDY8135010.1 uracil phosphoribosyltransferase [Aquimarina sp. 2201CG5-10]
MIIHNLGEENTILNQFVLELRDVQIQKDTMRFRRNIERVGEVLGYELSKKLEYTTKLVQTPLGTKEISVPEGELVLCSILRAGLPLHQGLLSYFDRAENAFISAYRDHKEDQDDFDIVVNYLASPSLDNKTLILADPMLATGKTLENTFKALASHGKPKQIHIVSVIGSDAGVAYADTIFPDNTHLWIAAVDNKLNSKSYIIPGLGDAGDLSYGGKL